MKIHYFQHVPFEDAANIALWAQLRGHTLSVTRFYQQEAPPPLEAIDWLVIMGGPMNIYEEHLYPWLAGEKGYIRQAIEDNKLVLGVCLGGQLICAALGGQVTRNPHKEIGWFETQLTFEGRQKNSLLSFLPPVFMPFHWHGDTFSIPIAATRLAASAACANQAFQYGNRVLALQFHLDYSIDSIETMNEDCASELAPGPFIQTPAQLCDPGRAATIQDYLYQLLDTMAKNAGS